MRYSEILEKTERTKSTQARSKIARDKIAKANHNRSVAAARYQGKLKACNDAIIKARAALREGSARSFELRDRQGSLLGWIEPRGRLIQAKDKFGLVVGWYDASQNMTRDRHGVVIGTGDLLSALIICGR